MYDGFLSGEFFGRLKYFCVLFSFDNKIALLLNSLKGFSKAITLFLGRFRFKSVFRSMKLHYQ